MLEDIESLSYGRTRAIGGLKYSWQGIWGQRAGRKVDQILHPMPARSMMPLSTIHQCE